jgi:nitrite reductase/ring-hydroxylating ferredoxin subunit
VTLRLSRRLANLAAPLDDTAEAAQSAVRNLPRAVRDLLDGTWLGAPLHPALTDVPLGAWTAAAVLDAVRSEAADHALAVGVAGAVGAAATGVNDWSHLHGKERRLGLVHALLNTTALALNVASLVQRSRGRRELGRMLSGLAFGGSLLSAHLGGQLSFGLGVRVNRTAWQRGPEDFEAVLDESELHGSELKRVEVAGAPVVVARAAGRICAIAATCSHLGGPLDEGKRDGDSVVCPWHGSQFDLCTGAVEHGPAVFPQPRYEARVRDGKLELRRAE